MGSPGLVPKSFLFTESSLVLKIKNSWLGLCLCMTSHNQCIINSNHLNTERPIHPKSRIFSVGYLNGHVICLTIPNLEKSPDLEGYYKGLN